MFDGNIFKEKSFRVVKEQEQSVGYEVETYVPYYREFLCQWFQMCE